MPLNQSHWWKASSEGVYDEIVANELDRYKLENENKRQTVQNRRRSISQAKWIRSANIKYRLQMALSIWWHQTDDYTPKWSFNNNNNAILKHNTNYNHGWWWTRAPPISNHFDFQSICIAIQLIWNGIVWTFGLFLTFSNTFTHG